MHVPHFEPNAMHSRHAVTQCSTCTFQPVNVVSWSPCGAYLASGGTDGAVCLWDVNSRLVYSKLKNEISIGITSMEWDPRGHGAQDGKQVDCQ